MTNKKALTILENHRGKLDDANYDSFFLWQQQSVTYIKTFLGEDSNEYNRITTIKFPNRLQSTKEEYEKNLNLLRHALISISNQSIETVKNLGIKRVYHNFLCRFSNNELIAGIFAVATTLITITVFILKAIYKQG